MKIYLVNNKQKFFGNSSEEITQKSKISILGYYEISPILDLFSSLLLNDLLTINYMTWSKEKFQRSKISEISEI